uniref:Sigma 54 modulation/S30EA ribosomal protein C-terminal domain-containing protein n=1 Tax=Pyramimonas obovata TaxID=1411642 RepID=A0A7S0R5Q6_9CHLO|mmetsp:Transcript_26202/g.56845  ORF Transcript_26202/g.56845 Transcript_26202/m.56845 type:complete len:268 (+) Transcript_26202:108-911(+)|eukprot:CAMPEP_0118935058 /NCGR_PEP_ID=MMETSP1169-20130426/14813_1 /TAXON_ID=36882 /ORGANISM="Pyramimonas obovata, Strain CCMP722" /LENGTH=267 /DNA_ID=CAMNT_0006878041 /DNA_START=86 /DNA_END=889 /DNA_ORIENTATION=+
MAFCLATTNALVAPRCAGLAAPRTPAARLSVPIRKLAFTESSAVFGDLRMQTTSARARAAAVRTGVVASLSTASVKVGTQGKNVEVTDAIKAHAEEKLGHAMKPFEESAGIRDVDVMFSTRGGQDSLGPKQQTVEVTVFTRQAGVFRVEESESNLYASIDKAADKLTRKLRKTKEKKGQKKGHSSAKELADAGVLEESVMGGVAKLPDEAVIPKYVDFKTMSVDDAIAALKLDKDHDFYPFINSGTGVMNIVYKQGGGFGNMIPRDD